MYKSRGDAVEEWLQAYRAEEKLIDEKLDQIRELRGKITGVKAQEITQMPRSPNIEDSMAEYVIRLEAMEGDLDRRLIEHRRDREVILKLLEGIKKRDEREIIRYRYLYVMEWPDVMVNVYREEEEFYKKQEAFRRRMFRAHRSALDWMGRNWNK